MARPPSSQQHAQHHGALRRAGPSRSIVDDAAGPTHVYTQDDGADISLVMMQMTVVMMLPRLPHAGAFSLVFSFPFSSGNRIFRCRRELILTRWRFPSLLTVSSSETRRRTFAPPTTSSWLA